MTSALFVADAVTTTTKATIHVDNRYGMTTYFSGIGYPDIVKINVKPVDKSFDTVNTIFYHLMAPLEDLVKRMSTGIKGNIRSSTRHIAWTRENVRSERVMKTASYSITMKIQSRGSSMYSHDRGPSSLYKMDIEITIIYKSRRLLILAGMATNIILYYIDNLPEKPKVYSRMPYTILTQGEIEHDEIYWNRVVPEYLDNGGVPDEPQTFTLFDGWEFDAYLDRSGVPLSVNNYNRCFCYHPFRAQCHFCGTAKCVSCAVFRDDPGATSYSFARCYMCNTDICMSCSGTLCARCMPNYLSSRFTLHEIYKYALLFKLEQSMSEFECSHTERSLHNLHAWEYRGQLVTGKRACLPERIRVYLAKKLDPACKYCVINMMLYGPHYPTLVKMITGRYIPPLKRSQSVSILNV